MNIVFLDSLTLNPGDLDWNVFRSLGHFTAYDRTEPGHVIDRAKDADIIITNKTPLRQEHFDALPRLRLICVAATGFDVVDTKAARAHGIPVCNCAGYGTKAVAQMVVALLLEVTNRVGHYAAANREGFWSNAQDFCCWNDPLTELDGKRLAVIGFGNIGKAVTDMLRPFGMELFAVTSKRKEELPEDVRKMDAEEAFTRCDVVSLNCPLTQENKRFVNEALLAKANPGLILINTARGKLIDDLAVAKALHEGRLKAYCCDVLSQEPPAKDHPLLSAPRAFVTPHIAWATREARLRILTIIVRNIEAFLQGQPQNVVNP